MNVSHSPNRPCSARNPTPNTAKASWARWDNSTIGTLKRREKPVGWKKTTNEWTPLGTDNIPPLALAPTIMTGLDDWRTPFAWRKERGWPKLNSSVCSRRGGTKLILTASLTSVSRWPYARTKLRSSCRGCLVCDRVICKSQKRRGMGTCHFGAIISAVQRVSAQRVEGQYTPY
jgi:hypothetical protein